MLLRLLILLFLFSAVSLSAQQIVVADAATKEPLPYASIVFFQFGKGLYTDNAGNLTLTERYNTTDSVCVQMLGYHDVRATIAALHDTVFMTPKVYALSEITVRPRTDRIQLGDTKKYGKRKYPISKDTTFWPVKMATIIRDEKRAGCYIGELLWRYHHHSAIHHVVRMQLYAVGSDGKPGEPLLRQSPPITIEGEGLLNMDVSEEHIVFPAEGVFVGVDILEQINPYGEPMVNIRKLPYARVLIHGLQGQTYLSYTKQTYWTAIVYSDLKMSEKVPFGLSLQCPK